MIRSKSFPMSLLILYLSPGSFSFPLILVVVESNSSPVSIFIYVCVSFSSITSGVSEPVSELPAVKSEYF
uniref:Uncharacterized protein n=1 Tax=Virus NIOZ-UU157 TaxID=2763269 RepID=A0A7S9SU65_9VIRU|nr:MAG: hypothetical protein NIOZUU157_00384 [Virus NIOZ-UU157]